MTQKTVPFAKDLVDKISKDYPTPFYIYDEKAIVDNAKKLTEAFSIFPNFKEFFAVKALPNPHIMKVLKGVGFGADCSSMAELVLSEKTGITGQNIMFTSNQTPASEYKKAYELGAIINLDDISHIEFLEKTIGKLPETLSFRYNPGPLKDGNSIIGKPEEAKYGLTTEQIYDAYKVAKEKGVKRFGIHTMVASNELNPEYFAETAKILFELTADVAKKVGIKFDFINLGGGIGIPYRLEQSAIDFKHLAGLIKKEYDASFNSLDFKPSLYLESGRAITGPFGYLVTKAVHYKNTYKNYIGVDACMTNLMRPGMYGAYHHITVLAKENSKDLQKYDVVGSLCENNDKFAVDRMLPKIEEGDVLVIHDSGAHGHAMGFNYNGKLRCAEFLLHPDGTTKLIRRAETLDDLFATLDFKTL